jgi:hypothetical protein
MQELPMNFQSKQVLKTVVQTQVIFLSLWLMMVIACITVITCMMLKWWENLSSRTILHVLRTVIIILLWIYPENKARMSVTMEIAWIEVSFIYLITTKYQVQLCFATNMPGYIWISNRKWTWCTTWENI